MSNIGLAFPLQFKAVNILKGGMDVLGSSFKDTNKKGFLFDCYKTEN